MNKYILDGTKLSYHYPRFQSWLRGERIAPVTIDMALTTACNYHCQFCAALGQTGKVEMLPWESIAQTLRDAADIGVKGIVLMSDGESTLSPYFADAILMGKSHGLDMAVATNGYRLPKELLQDILPCLTFLRFNVSAGEPGRYAEIHGVKPEAFKRVLLNIHTAVEIKRQNNLPVTLNISMVCQPKDADQIIPFAQLGKSLDVDYAIVKHCLDYAPCEHGGTGKFGVDYSEYEKVVAPLIHEAEKLSSPGYLVTAKWSKMQHGRHRDYKQCYGPPFLLQISGTGLVAACGPMFAPEYSRYHIGNIQQTRLKDLFRSTRYWQVMNSLRSPDFDTAKICPGFGCVQDYLNRAIDKHFKGAEILKENCGAVDHVNFI